MVADRDNAKDAQLYAHLCGRDADLAVRVGLEVLPMFPDQSSLVQALADPSANTGYRAHPPIPRSRGPNSAPDHVLTGVKRDTVSPGVDNSVAVCRERLAGSELKITVVRKVLEPSTYLTWFRWTSRLGIFRTLKSGNDLYKRWNS